MVGSTHCRPHCQLLPSISGASPDLFSACAGVAKESGKTIASWQALGHDLGTTVAKTPGNAEIITMARDVLLMPPSSV